MADTVTIGCKLPHGFVMEIVEPGPANIPLDRSKSVTIAGANSLRIAKTNPLVGAFATTEVDAEFAHAWFKRNRDLSFVKKGLVFLQKNVNDATAAIKERSELRTGLEPLNPTGDPRLPKGADADLAHLRALGVSA